MAVWLAITLAPPPWRGGGGASSRRTLLIVGLVALYLLPFSRELLQLRQDSDGLDRDGYEAVIVIDERSSEWELSPREGRLGQGAAAKP